MTDDSNDDRPALRVVKGEPSDEELAALVAVVAARTGNAGEARQVVKPRSCWRDPAHAMRPIPSPGPDGWRRSAFPR